MKLILSFLFSLKFMVADEVGPYIAYHESSLSSSSDKVTVQQIVNGYRDLQPLTASMWCSVAATFTLSRTGTAASATSLTAIPLNTWSPSSPSATSWSASNVGTGTVIRKYDFAAGAPEIVIDLADFLILRNAGTTGNISIGTNSVTGTCRINIVWKEKR
jgi:hypothetical protein